MPNVLTLLRSWKRQPGYVIAVLLALSIGLAAVCTAFALIHATLLRPLPVPEGHRLLQVHRVGGDEAALSLPNVIALRERLQQLDELAILADWSLDWQDGETPRKLAGALTESSYFRALGVEPLQGRLLQPVDDLAGAQAVAVISESMWRRHFNADPAAVGQSIRLSGETTLIIGVVADTADLANHGIDLWVPTPAFAPWALGSPGSNNLEVIARLAPSASIDSASAELRTVVQSLIAERDFGEHKRLALRPLKDFLSHGSRPALVLLSGFALLLLLLACVNVTAVMLIRMATRRREMMVRHALGAGHGHIARQLVAEGLTLGLAGGSLGLALAWLLYTLLQNHASEALPRLTGVSPGWGTAAFALFITVLTSVTLSLLAAGRVVRSRQVAVGGSRAVGSVSQRLMGTLITAEVALAVLLLCASVLLLRSFVALNRVPLGFDPSHALTVELVLPESRYSETDSQSEAVAGIVDNLQRSAGVESAAFVVGLPLTGTGSISHSFLIEGAPDVGSADSGVRFRPFHGDYFAAAGVPILHGRAVQSADQNPGERVAWVNAAFVQRWLGNTPAIGQRIAWVPGEAGPEENGPQWMRIVGVVGDTRTSSLREGDQPAVYLPYLQREDGWIRFGQLLVRMQSGVIASPTLIQSAVAHVDPEIALPAVRSWDERVIQATRTERFNLSIAAGFALIAVILGLQGIIGTIAFSIAQRREEIALRLALGATTVSLRYWQLRLGIWHVLVGLSCGALVAWLLAQLAVAALFEVGPADPWSYLAVAALTLIGGAFACWWPTRKLVDIQPSAVLKAQ